MAFSPYRRDDGRDMKEVSQLLSDAINSIIDVKEESDIDSLFSAGGTSALMNHPNAVRTGRPQKLQAPSQFPQRQDSL